MQVFSDLLPEEFLFVRSGFPLELPLPRFVASPQLFFRSAIPHHRGSARTFTAVRISRRSYPKLQKMPFLAVYRSVRPTTQTNCILMLRSCRMREIFRIIPGSFYAGKKSDKWYNASAVWRHAPLVFDCFLFILCKRNNRFAIVPLSS